MSPPPSPPSMYGVRRAVLPLWLDNSLLRLAMLYVLTIAHADGCFAGGGQTICCPPASMIGCAPAVPICDMNYGYGSYGAGGSYASPLIVNYPRPFGYQRVQFGGSECAERGAGGGRECVAVGAACCANCGGGTLPTGACHGEGCQGGAIPNGGPPCQGCESARCQGTTPCRGCMCQRSDFQGGGVSGACQGCASCPPGCQRTGCQGGDGGYFGAGQQNGGCQNGPQGNGGDCPGEKCLGNGCGGAAGCQRSGWQEGAAGFSGCQGGGGASQRGCQGASGCPQNEGAFCPPSLPSSPSGGGTGDGQTPCQGDTCGAVPPMSQTLPSEPCESSSAEGCVPESPSGSQSVRPQSQVQPCEPGQLCESSGGALPTPLPFAPSLAPAEPGTDQQEPMPLPQSPDDIGGMPTSQQELPLPQGDGVENYEDLNKGQENDQEETAPETVQAKELPPAIGLGSTTTILPSPPPPVGLPPPPPYPPPPPPPPPPAAPPGTHPPSASPSTDASSSASSSPSEEEEGTAPPFAENPYEMVNSRPAEEQQRQQQKHEHQTEEGGGETGGNYEDEAVKEAEGDETAGLSCEDGELRQIVQNSLESDSDNLEAARRIESEAAAKFGGRFNAIVSNNEFAYVNWYGKRNCQLRVGERHSLTWED